MRARNIVHNRVYLKKAEQVIGLRILFPRHCIPEL